MEAGGKTLRYVESEFHRSPGDWLTGACDKEAFLLWDDCNEGRIEGSRCISRERRNDIQDVDHLQRQLKFLVQDDKRSQIETPINITGVTSLSYSSVLVMLMMNLEIPVQYHPLLHNNKPTNFKLINASWQGVSAFNDTKWTFPSPCRPFNLS